MSQSSRLGWHISTFYEKLTLSVLCLLSALPFSFSANFCHCYILVVLAYDGKNVPLGFSTAPLSHCAVFWQALFIFMDQRPWDPFLTWPRFHTYGQTTEVCCEVFCFALLLLLFWEPQEVSWSTSGFNCSLFISYPSQKQFPLSG